VKNPQGPPNGAGALLDIRNAAVLLGLTEKGLRRQVERGRVPHRRLGRKLVFIQRELELWVADLPGVTLDQVREMQDRRGGA
jgi:predicted DNA-binding transcriptional regulator AlpA